MKLERLRKDAPDLLKASYETQKDAEARMMKKG